MYYSTSPGNCKGFFHGSEDRTGESRATVQPLCCRCKTGAYLRPRQCGFLTWRERILRLCQRVSRQGPGGGLRIVPESYARRHKPCLLAACASLRRTAGKRVRFCRPERSRRTRTPVIAVGNDAACGRLEGNGFFTSFRMTGKEERTDSSALSARFAPGPRWGPADRAGELRSEAQAMPFGGLRSAQNDNGEMHSFLSS